MKRLYLSILLLLLLVTLASGQSTTNTATRVRNGTALPSTCTTTGSNIFYRTDTGVLYVCTAANTWTGANLGGITVGAAISGGTTTRVLFDNAGLIAEDADLTFLTDTLTVSKVVVNKSFVQTVIALTDAATIAVDATLGNNFRVTLGGNRTLANPTGAVNGQVLTFELIQDGTGTRTLAYDTKYAFGTDITGAVLTTTVSKRDFLTVVYNSTADLFYVRGFVKGY